MSDLKMSYNEARWDIPLVALMLLVRQNLFNKNEGKGINLSDIDMIESGELDRMIKSQRASVRQ